MKIKTGSGSRIERLPRKGGTRNGWNREANVPGAIAGGRDISPQKLEKALQVLKELEKQQRQEEYEVQITKMAEELLSFTARQGKKEIRERTERILDKVQSMAFMEGYQYAVAILEESMVGMR